MFPVVGQLWRDADHLAHFLDFDNFCIFDFDSVNLRRFEGHFLNLYQCVLSITELESIYKGVKCGAREQNVAPDLKMPPSYLGN